MSEYLKFAHELADASGKVIRKYFRTKMTVEDKADNSPVTVADRLTETIMREMISKKFPDHDILGEEHGYQSTGSRWKWVLDPIDGTRSFVAGMPIFGTLICLMEQEIPQIGMIDIPILQERWCGLRKKDSIFYPNQPDGKPLACKVSNQKKSNIPFFTAQTRRCSTTLKNRTLIRLQHRQNWYDSVEIATAMDCWLPDT